jgi:hypothetical protein
MFVSTTWKFFRNWFRVYPETSHETAEAAPPESRRPARWQGATDFLLDKLFGPLYE